MPAFFMPCAETGQDPLPASDCESVIGPQVNYFYLSGMIVSVWHQIWQFFLAWYWIPLSLVYLGVILTILTENRNPGKSLAYILVLVFLPVIGIIIYYMVGRKPVFKKIDFDRKRVNDRQQMRRYFAQLEPVMEERLQKLEQDIGRLAIPFFYLYNQRQTLISAGNKVKLLNNGETKFPELFSALEAAESHIHLEYYIFTPDDVGNRIADILIRKASEGISVKVIFDDLGSNHNKIIPERFSRAGIPFVKTLPVTFTSLANSNYRNHRKIVVIDGEVGFVGGINLDDRYLNNGKHALYWRDTAVRIDGNAVKLLQVQFFLSWMFSGGKDDFLESKKDLVLEKSRPQGDAIVAIAVSGPSSDAPYILETILQCIYQASHSVRICTPYFIPNDQLTSALVVAASSGIEVELIIPGKSDSFIVQHASFSFIKPLLERGVKVYLYQKGFIHSKTISIDGKLAMIGTVNMDIRSFSLNFEIASLIYDERLCTEMEVAFEVDKADSSEITLSEWKSRSVWKRGLDSVCRLLAPLL